jgi:hypothetical protein
MKKEQIELLERIYNNLAPSNCCNALYIPPAQELRNRADRIEQEERDLIAFRKLLDSLAQSPRDKN